MILETEEQLVEIIGQPVYNAVASKIPGMPRWFEVARLFKWMSFKEVTYLAGVERKVAVKAWNALKKHELAMDGINRQVTSERELASLIGKARIRQTLATIADLDVFFDAMLAVKGAGPIADWRKAMIFLKCLNRSELIQLKGVGHVAAVKISNALRTVGIASPDSPRSKVENFLARLVDSGFLSEEKGDKSGGHLLAEARSLLRRCREGRSL